MRFSSVLIVLSAILVVSCAPNEPKDITPEPEGGKGLSLDDIWDGVARAQGEANIQKNPKLGVEEFTRPSRFFW
jgi:hypothetical protein